MPRIIPDYDPLVSRIERIIGNPLVILGGLTVALIFPVVLIWLLLKTEWFRWILANQFSFSLLLAALIVFIVLHLGGIATLFERKIASWIQDRIGPNRVGFWGILQPLADGVKFILKEDIIPGNVEKPAYVMAPFLAFLVAFVTFAVIPWAGRVHWPWMPEGETVTTQVANVDVGLLYIIAVSSLSVYGVVLGGWASNNKYAFYGGTRAAAQMISYEVPLGLGILVVLLTSGSLDPNKIIADQANSGVWNFIMHPVATILVLVAAFAEANRTPFDLAEAEQELVGGYHTEYSSMKLAIFLLSEYVHMTFGSALFILLFFGGWDLIPTFGLFKAWPQTDDTSWVAMLGRFAIFWGKICAMIFLYMVIRWTIPRFRFDQLMAVAWKGLIPAGMVMLFAEAFLVAFDLHTHRTWWASTLVNVAAIIAFLVAAARSRQPVTGRQGNLPAVPTLTGGA
jgi:NADH-quinone oxidoreductase subunit H